jgi:MoaA/NifB/PqqE/SkfB family radical SAM enzyme
MHKVPLGESLRVVGRGTVNWFSHRPLVVSFEVTDSCTCWCKHCDHGGPQDNVKNLKPTDYRRYMEALKPAVVQVSGGEPLMRRDIVDVVRNIKDTSTGMPYTILVSNWSQMTEDRYAALREVGIDQFSVSLDFPDERHDTFRGHPGLFHHLSRIVPRLSALGFDDIVMNTCITSENVGEINAAADKAHEWGANINFSAYSPRRTGNQDYFLNTPEQMAVLQRELTKLKARLPRAPWIISTGSTLDATERYFQNHGVPGCKAGQRWLVVTADGAMQPCSMQFKRYALGEQAKMIEEFTAHNTCDQCYVSIRSMLDKSFPRLVGEYVGGFFSFKPRAEGLAAEAEPARS